MRLPSLRPSPSMAVSIMALVVASTGTSYAAGLIGSDDVKNNSLQSSDIKDKTIKGRDIKNNVIGSNKIRNGSLKERDFKAGVLKSGPAGPAGPAGVGRWALIDANGAIVAQSGGFEVEFAYPTLPNTAVGGAPDNSLRASGNVYIETNEDLTNNGIIATIALQNSVDQDGGGMAGRTPPGSTTPPNMNAEFSGEISVSQCGLPGTTCAPPGTNFPEYVVVSPRNSDGSVTQPGVRKRFYVVITGDSSDRS
ncbi:hypothetical protein [Nocardioides zhouii]|uniref:Uncharacterized protein n=1 Tax=Nocardioides zhouii TaxID=1168729 RepID=A0A4Q2T0R6_9ACTN|nr:hypothetical protein [Nocardioides zhouii]RYC11461.1 hypothetical protein EUA94_08800 [Nocardioides zhouii]